MGDTIWLWLKEKFTRFMQLIGAGLKRLRLSIATYLKNLSASTWRKIAAAIPLAFLLYIFIGMAVVHRIDTSDIAFDTTNNGGAAVIAVTATLVEREAVLHRWTPNDPFIMPGWWLDNTPNFQSGILHALSRISIELRDQIGRSRGSSATDDDLNAAAGNLAKEPDRWVVNFSTSLLPTTASETYYAEAVKQLRHYNERLAAGDAIFDQRADNLLATLDRIALDLGDTSASIDEHVMNNAGGFLPDTLADNIFYHTKGQAYAYKEVLVALKQDFAEIIATRDIANIYQELLLSLSAVVSLDPFIVTNGAKDGILPNHLATQGFYLLRARTQLREVTNILLK